VTEPTAPSVCAVVVAYRPDPKSLHHLLASLEGQVDAALVVDNTEREYLGAVIPDWSGVIQLLRPGSNLGLAAAQNLGIAWARERGYGYVLFLDQDSEPTPGMVRRLLAAFAPLAGDAPIAAAGPRFRDDREQHDAPFVRVAFPMNRKLVCHGAGRIVAPDFLISSGMLVPMHVLDVVGVMDAGLFIDNVDLEWCFRARARGYVLRGVGDAVMRHRLGDARRRMPFGLRQIVVHGPQRLYYIFRNRVLLYGMPHTPWLWVAQDVPRALVKLLLFGVLIGPRLKNWRYMLRGVLDGVRGRKGACPIHSR
jgi:rhamnosyltransferase